MDHLDFLLMSSVSGKKEVESKCLHSASRSCAVEERGKLLFPLLIPWFEIYVIV